MKGRETFSSRVCFPFCSIQKCWTGPVCVIITAVLTTALLLLCPLTLSLWNGEQNDEIHQFQKSREMKIYFEKFVKQINESPNLKWKAKYNPFGIRSTGSDIIINKNLVNDEDRIIEGKLIDDIFKFHKSDLMKQHIRILNDFPASQLPDKFDARKRWPQCSSIHDVPNQGGCGSCYAVAVAGVASDRMCISTNGTVQVTLSPDDIVSCCTACGTCFGGDPLKALIYWVNEGIVTGGQDGCRPYPYDIKCGVPCPLFEFAKNVKLQKCDRKCQKIYYQNDYFNDKYFASIAYTMVPRILPLPAYGNIPIPAVMDYFNYDIANTTEKLPHIQKTLEILKKELYLFGPMTMAFPVTEEFLHYANGIYTPFPENDFTKRIIYWHVVRIIGWGHDRERLFYWTAVNSYGRSWGEYGLFRIDVRFLEQFGLEYEAALV